MPLMASFVVVSCASATAYGFFRDPVRVADRPAIVADAAPTESLVEAPDCAVSRAQAAEETTTVAPSEGGGSAAVQQLVVVVPPTVIVHVDAAGHLVSVSTNTGCAPHRLDVWWVMQPDGTAARTASAAFDGVRWVGDFTQTGIAQPQP